MIILRMPEVLRTRGEASHSSPYAAVHNGTLTTPVKLGLRSVGWPDYEIEAINQARVRGDSDEELRALVVKLHNARMVGVDRPFVSDFFERSARIKQQVVGRVKRGTVATA
jgi:prophage regulatory protein